MKILVIGSGGREHALAWKMSKSQTVSKIYCAPGNAGTAQIAQNVEIQAENIPALLEFALKEKIDLTVVGPEGPLAKGIVDEFQKQGQKIFGPTKAAAMIESSKIYAKELMKKTGVPTAGYRIISNIDEAIEFAQNHEKTVVKADGLAAGKGVFVCSTKQEMLAAANMFLQEKIFGETSGKIIIEEFLEGEEASVLAFCDGDTAKLMVPSQDHKRAFDGDNGPNTGGMGAYAPTPIVPEKMQKEIEREIFLPVLLELKKRQTPFTGVLYAGLMISKGKPFVLEFNARFGDPETQAILPLLETDLVKIMLSCTNKTLAGQKIEWNKKTAACVVIASGGYPQNFEKGKTISGLNEAGKIDGAIVFHAGTKKENGKIVSNGGRVLGVTAIAGTVFESVQKAYNAVEKISFENMQYRKDIGWRAISKTTIEKEKIRTLINHRRNRLSPHEIREKSKAIREKLFELPEFKNAKNIFCYISFSSEVRTIEFIEKCAKLKKKVLVPVVDKNSNEITPAEYPGFDRLKKGAYGIMEPAVAKEFPKEKIDLVIVPGIAFDENCNRIGFGKGYFDKFLAKLEPATPTIALAFDLQIVARIPASEHDIKMKKIITEKMEIESK
ncbi:MAG: phosphoribosylamine--glycine ligase [archaeon]